MERYICIHGHFYQPPRENPWPEVIEEQDGARPYHDWNERIAVECYAANTASRILDQHGLIERIVNNYAGISFDFGPTLLSWLESHAPEVYEALRDADRESERRFSGPGSPLAPSYHALDDYTGSEDLTGAAMTDHLPLPRITDAMSNGDRSHDELPDVSPTIERRSGGGLVFSALESKLQ